MKMILKDGSEHIIDSFNYIHNFKSVESKSSYSITINCDGSVIKEKKDALEKALTVENISKVTFMTEGNDVKSTLEYSFAEVEKLHMNVNDNQCVINVQLIV